MHRTITTHLSAVVVTLVALLTVVTTTAGPAAADRAQTWPSDAWWYTLFGLQKVWKISEGGGVTVAVLDTGVQADVGDLHGQVLRGHDVTGRTTDARTDLPNEGDTGHGTFMAQLIAGTGGGAGLVGVAPKAKILPVAVCTGESDSANCSPDDIASGIRWAVNNGADIVNVSLELPTRCANTPQLQDAVTYAYRHDVLVVAGAGNNGGIVGTPASCVGALAIGAVDANFRPWSAESHGPELAFVAPGLNIPQPTLSGRWLSGTAGTSIATALVSGTFAVIKSKFPDDSARDLVTRALWTLHNGPAVEGFAKRINNKLGYGQPLPYYALTVNVKKGAANPIYDQIDAWMAQHASPTATPSASPDATTSDAPNAPATDPIDNGGISPMAVIVIALGVVIVVALIIIAIRRTKRRE